MERTVATSSSQNGLSKLECFSRFDTAAYWQSRTRDLVSNAETYSHPAFAESLWELRREARKSEMELVMALFKFEKSMKKQVSDPDNE